MVRTINPTSSPSSRAARPMPGMAVLALAVVVAYALLGEPWLARNGLGDTSRAQTGMGILWSLVGLVALTVRRVERLPWSSLGLRRLDGRTALFAVGVGIVLMLLVPLLTVAATFGTSRFSRRCAVLLGKALLVAKSDSVVTPWLIWPSSANVFPIDVLPSHAFEPHGTMDDSIMWNPVQPC